MWREIIKEKTDNASQKHTFAFEHPGIGHANDSLNYEAVHRLARSGIIEVYDCFIFHYATMDTPFKSFN